MITIPNSAMMMLVLTRRVRIATARITMVFRQKRKKKEKEVEVECGAYAFWASQRWIPSFLWGVMGLFNPACTGAPRSEATLRHRRWVQASPRSLVGN